MAIPLRLSFFFFNLRFFIQRSDMPYRYPMQLLCLKIDIYSKN